MAEKRKLWEKSDAENLYLLVKKENTTSVVFLGVKFYAERALCFYISGMPHDLELRPPISHVGSGSYRREELLLEGKGV